MILQCSLQATYPDFTLDLSFTIKEGDLVCLIGPSGCGKSTTLSMIAGLIRADEGSIILGGEDISQKEVHKRNIAMVFQDYSLFPHMNVQQNIAYPLKNLKMKRKQRISVIENLLDLVNLQGYEKRKPLNLSGGERQRVALARALASQPKVLLLDEPLSALDAKLRTHLREEIRRIHEETGITTIYVTHDQDEALAIADEVIVMDQGRIIQQGSSEEIYRTPKTKFVATFTGEGTILPAKIFAPTLRNPHTLEIPPEHRDKRNTSLFFRPNDVRLIEDEGAVRIQYLPFLSFEGALLLRSEFQGTHWRNICAWGEYEIICFSEKRPKKKTFTLHVDITDLSYFKE